MLSLRSSILFAVSVLSFLLFVVFQSGFKFSNDSSSSSRSKNKNEFDNFAEETKGSTRRPTTTTTPVAVPKPPPLPPAKQISSPSSSSSSVSTGNWTSLLSPDDAAGQIWQFPDESESFSRVRPSMKTYQQIIDEYAKCKGQSNMSGEPDPELVRKAAQSTPLWTASDNDIVNICKKRQTTRIKDPNQIPFLVYGALFGFEVDIVEIMLHEVIPVVDGVVLAESTMTHAKHLKPLVLRDLLTSRLKRFAHLVPPLNDDVLHWQYDLKNSLNSTNKHFKIFPKAYVTQKQRSGWDVEKKQRREFQRAISGVLKYLIAAAPNAGVAARRPVIVISQLDLDEIPSRETLLYWKYCVNPSLPLRVFWFRYHLECQQQQEHSRFTTTIWRLRTASRVLPLDLDLYAKRKDVVPVNNSLEDLNKNLCETAMLGKGDPAVAWHFSAFGGLLAVRRKNKHSPHSFVRLEVIREEELRNCIFNHVKRYPLSPEWWQCNSNDEKMRTYISPQDRTAVMPVALPHFVSENICMFTKMGWMS